MFLALFTNFALADVPENWNVNSGALTVEQQSGNFVSEGTSSAKATWTSQSNQDLDSDEFTVTEGTDFSLTVEVNDNDAAGRVRLAVDWSAGSNTYGDYSVDQEGWQTVTLTGTVPSGATTAHVKLRFYDISGDWDGDAVVYLDNVSFTNGGANLVLNGGFETWVAPPTATAYTIVEIQTPGTDGESSQHNGELVETSGTITAAGSYYYFIQDGTSDYSGLYIYNDPGTAVVGDNVTVTGTVEENYGVTRINGVTETTVNSSGNDLPTAMLLTTGSLSEAHEGMLVKVSGECTAASTDAGGDHWAFKLDDGSGDALVDDQIFSDAENAVTIGSSYDVVGPVNYYFNNFTVNPRNAADVVDAAMSGDTCEDPIALTLPAVSMAGSSDGFADDYSSGGSYMGGIDIVYSFSLTEDGSISGDQTNAGGEWTGMFVLDGCPDAGGAVIALATGGSSGSFTDVAISAGDYFLVMSNWPTPNDFSYTFNLSFTAGAVPQPDFVVSSMTSLADTVFATVTNQGDGDSPGYNGGGTDYHKWSIDGAMTGYVTSPALAAGASVTFKAYGLTYAAYGAGTFSVGFYADVDNDTEESDETNNDSFLDFTVDVPDYIPSYTVYRDGTSIATDVDVSVYQDVGLTNGTEYCYIVTQNMEDELESGESDPACATPEAPPAGSSCDNPIAYGAINGTAVSGATVEANDADWYSFVLDQDYDDVSVSLCGSGFDTKLEVWGECDDASYLGYGDDTYACDGSYSSTSQVDLADLTAGTYYAKVYGYSSFFGDYVLTITGSVDPASPVLTATGEVGAVSLGWDAVPTGLLSAPPPTNEAPGDVVAYMEAKYATEYGMIQIDNPDLSSNRDVACVNHMVSLAYLWTGTSTYVSLYPVAAGTVSLDSVNFGDYSGAWVYLTEADALVSIDLADANGTTVSNITSGTVTTDGSRGTLDLTGVADFEFDGTGYIKVSMTPLTDVYADGTSMAPYPLSDNGGFATGLTGIADTLNPSVFVSGPYNWDIELCGTFPDPFESTFTLYKNAVLYQSDLMGNSFMDHDVVDATQYCYTVTQNMEDGSVSGASNEACATPLATPPGYDCEHAIAAVAGENNVDAQPKWYEYTATLDGFLTISSQNAAGDAMWDTDLYVYQNCDAGGPVASNDDYWYYAGPSMVSLAVETGDNFKIHWADSWDTQSFTFTIEESLPLNIYPPSSFMAVAGWERIDVSWGYPSPPARSELVVPGGSAFPENEEASTLVPGKYRRDKSTYYQQQNNDTHIENKIQIDNPGQSASSREEMCVNHNPFWWYIWTGGDTYVSLYPSPEGTVSLDSVSFADYSGAYVYLTEADAYVSIDLADANGTTVSNITSGTVTTDGSNGTLDLTGVADFEFDGTGYIKVSMTPLTDVSTDVLIMAPIPLSDDGYYATGLTGMADTLDPSVFVSGSYNWDIELCADFPEPPDCVDDQFEPNNMFEDGTTIAAADTVNLTICSGDEDWFTGTLQGHERIDLTLIDTTGSMELYFWDIGFDPEYEVASTAGNDTLNLSWTNPGTEPTTWYALYSAGSTDPLAQSTYKMEVVFTAPENYTYNLYSDDGTLILNTPDYAYSALELVNGTEYGFYATTVDDENNESVPTTTAYATPVADNMLPPDALEGVAGLESALLTWLPPFLATCDDDAFEDDDTKGEATDHGENGAWDYLLCSEDNSRGEIDQPGGFKAVDWSAVTLEPGQTLTATTTGDADSDIDMFFEDINGDGICAWGGGDDLAGSGTNACEETASWENTTEQTVTVYVGLIYYDGLDPIPYNLTLETSRTTFASVSDPTNSESIMRKMAAAEENQTSNENRDFLGYVVHGAISDGQFAALDTVMETTFSDLGLTAGLEHHYKVTRLYNDGESEPAGPVTIVPLSPSCAPPENLQGTSTGNNVSLSWGPPLGGAGWIHWDDGMAAGAYGWANGGEAFMASRFTPEELASVNGMSLTKVRFQNYDNVPEDSYQVCVWTADPGGSPTLIYQSDIMYNSELVGWGYGWNEVDLSMPITVDWTQELWVGYHFVGTYGLVVDAGPATVGYGDLFSSDGVTFGSSGIPGNNVVQGFVDYADGRSISSFSPIDISLLSQNTNNDETELTNAVLRPPSETPTETRDLTSYIIYRDDLAIDTVSLSVSTYQDRAVEWGPHSYFVTSLYNDSEDCGESGPSNIVNLNLENSAPPAPVIQQPEDGHGIVVAQGDMDNAFPFIWTVVNDPDNDPVTYVVSMTDDMGAVADTTMSTAGWFPTIGELAAVQLEDSVDFMTHTWTVYAADPWDTTAASNGPRTLTIDVSGMLSLDGIDLPQVFALHNNYPNPFNPVTNITYDIPEVAQVTLDIYNVSGQKVRTLAQGQHEPGRYRIQWNATNDYGNPLSSGMYIYRIHAGDFVSVKKLILMK
jgi:hypothetical protein